VSASLVVMVGRASPGWAEGLATATAAADLRGRLIALGQEDVEVISDLIGLTRRREMSGPESPEARAEREHALLRASRTPLEIAELAAEVAGLAAQAATNGRPPMRADASAARGLAVAATRSAASVVTGYLAAGGHFPPADEAARLREAALRALVRAEETGSPVDRATDPHGDYRGTRRDIERLWEQQDEHRPAIERLGSRKAMGEADTGIVDLLAGEGRGPLWGEATADLNLTLLSWPKGQGPSEHVNGELDVAYVIVAGSGTLVVDNEKSNVRSGQAIIVARGASRVLEAGPDGIRYLSVHRRRGGLRIGRVAERRERLPPPPSH
jgi:mannose-6-phosphate isomerase-like protein (cupin superfamily)